jgi:hypothetical protein
VSDAPDGRYFDAEGITSQNFELPGRAFNKHCRHCRTRSCIDAVEVDLAFRVRPPHEASPGAMLIGVPPLSRRSPLARAWCNASFSEAEMSGRCLTSHASPFLVG